MKNNNSLKSSNSEDKKQKSSNSKDISNNTIDENSSDSIQEFSEVEDDFKDELITANIFYRDVLNAIYDGDTGSARLFSKLFKDKYLFDGSEKRWYIFSGGKKGYIVDDYKEHIKNTEIIKGLYLCYKNRHEESMLKAKTLLGKKDPILHCIQQQTKRIDTCKGREEIIKLTIVGENSLNIFDPKWDESPYMIPFQNGVFDVRMGLFRNYTRNDFLKKRMSVEYDEKAECPRFLESLIDAVGEEKASYLLDFMAYTLWRNPREERIVILQGPGRNFKGVFLETMQNVMGELAGPININMLLRHRNTPDPNSASPELINLKGKALTIASEPNEGQIFDAKLKDLSGNNVIHGRKLYQSDYSDFRPTHSIILETNHIPHSSVSDKALQSRILIIKFPKVYLDNPDPKNPNEGQIDVNLKAYIRENELKGVGKLLAERSSELFNSTEQRIKVPEIIKKETADFWSEEDDIQKFIDLRLNINAKPEDKVNSSGYHLQELFEDYRELCESDGLYPFKIKEFIRSLSNKLNYKKNRDSAGVYFAKKGCNYPAVVLKNNLV